MEPSGFKLFSSFTQCFGSSQPEHELEGVVLIPNSEGDEAELEKKFNAIRKPYRDEIQLLHNKYREVMVKETLDRSQQQFDKQLTGKTSSQSKRF